MAQAQQNNAPSQTAAPSTQKNSKLILYVIAGIVVIVLVAAALILLTNSPTPANQNIETNATNANLSSAAKSYYADLEKATQLSSISVTYFAGSNTTSTPAPSGNGTIVLFDNQTIQAYKLGNYNKSILTDDAVYKGKTNGTVVAYNITQFYYDQTPNETITCLNSSTMYSGVTNSSLNCAQGIDGQYYADAFPFTVGNLTWMGYLGQENVTMLGTMSIMGRTCDNFRISNSTGNLLSNYSIVDTCLDTQYGVPLYYNETDVYSGSPQQGLFLQAVNFSTSVSSSTFVIPESYNNAT